MMSRVFASWRLIIGVAAMCVAVGVIRAQPGAGELANDGALLARFLKEAPAAWERYAAQAESFQGSFQFDTTTSQGLVARNEYVIKKNGSATLVESTGRLSTNGQQRYHDRNVYAINADYVFSLVKKKEDAPWLLTEYHDLRDDSVPEYMRRQFDDAAIPCFDLMTVEGLRLAKLVRKEGIRFVSCRKSVNTGDDLIEVRFDYPHPVPSGSTRDSFEPVRSGKLVLDPARFWCLRYYEVQVLTTSGRGTRTFKVLELSTTGESVPVPRSTVFQGVFERSDGKISNERRFEYQLRLPRRLPADDEFRLSAYGLPEPIEYASRRAGTRWYLWLAIGGIVCIAVAGVVYRFRGRLT